MRYLSRIASTLAENQQFSQPHRLNRSALSSTAVYKFLNFKIAYLFRATQKPQTGANRGKPGQKPQIGTNWGKCPKSGQTGQTRAKWGKSDTAGGVSDLSVLRGCKSKTSLTCVRPVPYSVPAQQVAAETSLSALYLTGKALETSAYGLANPYRETSLSPLYNNGKDCMMTGYTLTVTVPDKATFDAYYYGYGDIVFMTEMLTPGKLTVEIDYGLDLYHLRYQEGRFASGLYFCRIGEYSTSSVDS